MPNYVFFVPKSIRKLQHQFLEIDLEYNTCITKIGQNTRRPPGPDFKELRAKKKGPGGRESRPGGIYRSITHQAENPTMVAHHLNDENLKPGHRSGLQNPSIEVSVCTTFSKFFFEIPTQPNFLFCY